MILLDPKAEAKEKLPVQETLLLLETQGLEGLCRDDFSQDVDVATVVMFCAKNKSPLPNSLARSLLASSEFHPENLDAAIEIEPSLYASCLEVLRPYPRLLQRFAATAMTELVREGLSRIHPTYLDYSQTPPRLSTDDLSYFYSRRRYEVMVWCRAFDTIPIAILITLCRRTPQIFDAVVAFLYEDQPSIADESYTEMLAGVIANDQDLWQSARTYQAALFVQACSASGYPVALYAQVAKYALGKHLSYLWDDPNRDPLDLTELWYGLSHDTQADLVESLAPARLDNDPTPAQKDACERFLRESPQSGPSALRSLNAPYNSPLKAAVRRRLYDMTPPQQAVLELLLRGLVAPYGQTSAPFDHIVASLRSL